MSCSSVSHSYLQSSSEIEEDAEFTRNLNKPFWSQRCAAALTCYFLPYLQAGTVLLLCSSICIYVEGDVTSQTIAVLYQVADS